MVLNKLLDVGRVGSTQHPFLYCTCKLQQRRLQRHPRLRCRPQASAGTATPEENDYNRMGSQSEASSSSQSSRWSVATCTVCYMAFSMPVECSRPGLLQVPVKCRSYDTEALPENFCIIESRESVRVSKGPCSSCEGLLMKCAHVYLYYLRPVGCTGLCKAAARGDQPEHFRAPQQDIFAYGGSAAAAHSTAHQGDPTA